MEGLFIAVIPLVIGVLLYIYMGKLLFMDFLNFLRVQGEIYLGSGKLNATVYYVVMALLVVCSYFIVGWTFVLSVSILAAPFNSWLSGRVITLIGGGSGQKQKPGFFSLVWSELKKVTLIVTLSLGAMIIAFIPFGAPISFVLSAFLVFHKLLRLSLECAELGWKEIVKEIKGNTLVYFCQELFSSSFGNSLLNIMIYPIAVIFFSCLQIGAKY